MAKLSTGHVLTGAVLALSGGGVLVAGVLRLPFLPASVLHVDGGTFALVVGSVLLVGAFLLFAFAPRREEGPEPSVPAHVAFSSRQHQGEVEPPRPAPRAARASPAASAAAAKRAALPPDLVMLDSRIKEVTREINKAGVMLATGKLSREGYTQYVEDLKRQRGELEAAKMSLEIRRHGV